MATVLTPIASGRRGGTPRRLGLVLMVILVGCLGFGIASVITADSHANATGALAHSDGRLSLDAQRLYSSLADADTTAASTYLQGGTESATARSRYLADIAAASSALSDATRTAGNDPAVTGDVGVLADDLPTYTGLIETARADNRLNLPVGGAYLGEAANLMRTAMLPAAGSLLSVESTRLNNDESTGSGFPYVAVLIGLAVLALLIYVQIGLSRRTHRTLNLGLVGATGAVLVVMITMLVGLLSAGGRIDHGDNAGEKQVQPLVQAETAALRGHGDECLFLVAGGEDATYSNDFAVAERQFKAALGSADAVDTDADIQAAVGDASKWESAHTALMSDNNNGDFNSAVASAIGSGAAASSFARLDSALTNAISKDQATFSQSADAAASDTSGLAPALAVVSLLAMAGCVVGIGARLREYR